MDSSYPFAPLLDLLRASVVPTPGSPDLNPIVLEFARPLPELARVPADVPPTSLSDPEQEKRRLFAALTRFFKEQASRYPVLAIIEDLHWCDDTSLEFLQTSRVSLTPSPFCC